MNNQILCTVVFKNQKPLQPLYVIKGTLKPEQILSLLEQEYSYEVFQIADLSPYCIVFYDDEIMYSVLALDPNAGCSYVICLKRSVIKSIDQETFEQVLKDLKTKSIRQSERGDSKHFLTVLYKKNGRPKYLIDDLLSKKTLFLLLQSGYLYSVIEKEDISSKEWIVEYGESGISEKVRGDYIHNVVSIHPEKSYLPTLLCSFVALEKMDLEKANPCFEKIIEKKKNKSKPKLKDESKDPLNFAYELFERRGL